MKPPLLVLREWFDRQAIVVQGRLALWSLIYTGNAGWIDPKRIDGDAVIRVYREWLSERVLNSWHLGRCLCARSLIDFLFEGWRDEADWEAHLATLQEQSATMIVTMEEAALMREMRVHFDSDKAHWMAAAEGWQQLRRAGLSLDALRAWEMDEPAVRVVAMPPLESGVAR